MEPLGQESHRLNPPLMQTAGASQTGRARADDQRMKRSFVHYWFF